MKKLILLILIAIPAFSQTTRLPFYMVGAAPAGDITLTDTSVVGTSWDNTLTGRITPSGSNRVVIAFISTGAGPSDSVRCGAVKFTRIIWHKYGGTNAEAWFLVNPPAADTAIVSYNAAAAYQSISMVLASFSNVNQTTTWSDSLAAEAYNTTVTVTIPNGATGNWIVDAASSQDMTGLTFGGGQTAIGTGTWVSASYKSAATGNNNMTRSAGNGEQAIIGFQLHKVGQ
jgi:hypothetical protein